MHSIVIIFPHAFHTGQLGWDGASLLRHHIMVYIAEHTQVIFSLALTPQVVPIAGVHPSWQRETGTTVCWRAVYTAINSDLCCVIMYRRGLISVVKLVHCYNTCCAIWHNHWRVLVHCLGVQHLHILVATEQPHITGSQAVYIII